MDDEDFTIEDGQTEQEIEPTELMSREQYLAYNKLDHSDIKADLLWAYNALGVKDLTPEDALEAGCPSAGAWFIYATAKDDDLARKSFITQTVTKLLPTKAQMEKDDRAEDGRKCFDLIERLLQEPASDAPVLSGTERRARQLALQTTGS